MSLLAAAAVLERAGGGHGFSGGGGGGGGGGSFGGGGGGFFFFPGGGGGGAGFGFFILILIALFIFFAVLRPRMNRRIGGRGSTFRDSVDGGPGAPLSPPASSDWSHSDQPAINSVRGDLFPGTADNAMHPESSSEGLAAITAHDPDFDKEAFLEQVQRTFFVVQEAWSQRKPDMSRQVMADGLWQQHKVQIQGYIDAHKRNVLEDLAVADLSIIAAHSDTTYDTITVRVTAGCADYDVDDQSGKVVRGNKAFENWMEDWTFQRSSSATTKPAGGTMSAHCPNCGAPLDLDLAGVCKYCKAPISSGAYDWVLARIAQVPAYY
jgi:predicted lipid-binding transport protein (Tim44 family)